MQERRKHQRFRVALPVRVSYIETGEGDSSRRVFRTVTENISEGGMAFVSPKRLVRGAELKCVVTLSKQEGAGKVSFACTIVRIEKSRKSDHVKIAVAAHGHRFLKSRTSH